ncbi:MAG TPA: flavodoxin-dependent (E)-4-hydroxy-3-methylbut-2-enyl-diphosphate synthase [Holophaga sp.]|nr:flavodoxin-dependent (E)-4-hydroxy-3-methylbut-2-enyl-diphosphate synthase [Holophaga sp.]HPS68433.1 flavodoxin-dependent (E)-4-hydroxy-3-methylbut-2-enyl-diphosphate synthase [Holophaga sp.]
MSELELKPLAPRRKSRQIMVGGVPVGGDAPIPVQSMTKTDSRDVEATVRQIYDYAAAGCEIVRVSVPTAKAGEAFREICARSPIPVVADIHFDYRLALAAADGGAACLRINPGNIGGRERVKAVVDKAGEKGIPIRIGVNGGSLEKDLLEKFGHATPEAMVESAFRHLELLEKEGFRDTKLSLKASDVPRTVQAYRLLARQVDYPLHLGITEAGTPWAATILSSIGMGILLAEGIGDTIRVSLTGEGTEECRVGHEMLRALGLRSGGFRMVSCPGCGRTQIDLGRIAKEIETGLREINHEHVTYAVMGCVVNGPGEAREADLGVAGGAGEGRIYRKGELIRKVKEEDLVPAFLEEARRLKSEHEQKA